ncbi:MAG: class I SAM-dependent methyltransferase [Thermodesulfobacteriota bacterium]
MGSREYFDRVAGRWDEMRRGFFSEAVRDKALAAAGVEPGRRAADVGAGSGFLTEGLLSRGLSVVAVDQSPEMLEEMKRKFGAAEGLELRKGAAGSLPLADGEVDYVLANMYLHHVESPGEAVREMVRALRPGGTLVITDLDEHRFDFLLKEHNDRWPGFKREDVRKWFEQAGLSEVAVDCAGENCCAASECGGQEAQVNIFLAKGRK